MANEVKRFGQPEPGGKSPNESRRFDVTARTGVPFDEDWSKQRNYRAPHDQPPGVAPLTIQYYPPWIKRPDVYQDFYFRTAIGTAVPALSTISPPEVQLQTIVGQRGVISAVTIFVDAPNNTLDVTWILKFNTDPVPGWSIGSFARAATNLSIAYNEQAIRIREGQLVSWSIVNNTAVSWTVGVEYSGWTYPASEEMRIMGKLT